MEASDGKEMILQSGAFLMPGKDKKMIETNYEVETNEKEDKKCVSALDVRPPLAHPKNCRSECPYGHNRSFCFPCYKKIMEERRVTKGA